MSASSTSRPRPRDTALEIATSLASLGELCTAMACRHRNQHRSSAWWGRFNIFRRGVGKIVSCSKNGGSGGRGPRGGKRIKSGQASKSGQTGTDKSTLTTKEAEAMLVRAAWFHTHVVPACFVSFSQLAADPRHATLGLALLGALATAKTATELAMPSPPTLKPSSTLTPSTTPTPAPILPTTEIPEPDYGTAIPRPPKRKVKPAASAKKSRKKDDIASLFDSLI